MSGPLWGRCVRKLINAPTTLQDTAPIEYIEATDAAGYDGIGLRVHRSPGLHVSEGTPPTFLVHAVDDPAVPLENSLLMLGALRGARRPVEAHLFERGGHGFGTGRPGDPTTEWPTLFANWMQTHAV